jgi:hypothetical protein
MFIFQKYCDIICIVINADMAELADALDSGSSEGNFVQVQILLSAPALKLVTVRVCRFYFFYKKTIDIS